MERRELLVAIGGGVVFIILAFVFATNVQEEFASPSGAAYQWAIGVVVVLLAGIIGISAFFSWIRRRELAFAVSPSSPSQSEILNIKKAL